MTHLHRSSRTGKAKWSPLEIYESTNPIGKAAWYWRLTARNGYIVADSGEGYTSKAKAAQGFRAAKRLMLLAKVPAQIRREKRKGTRR